MNDLLELIIKFASRLFMILGSFAFAFFVYGGFKMIISMGNAETVETGKNNDCRRARARGCLCLYRDWPDAGYFECEYGF